MPDGQERPLPVSSSRPPDFPAEQEALFREVILLMEREKIPFAISGAFALHEHTGIWRDTKDLDLFLPSEQVPRALRVLEKDQFTVEVCDPVWLAKARRAAYYPCPITRVRHASVPADLSSR